MPDEYDVTEEYTDKRARDRRAKALRSEEYWVQTETDSDGYRLYGKKKQKRDEGGEA